MNFKIFGSWRGNTEEIDSVNSEDHKNVAEEAERLVEEYRIAFGPNWLIWAEDNKTDKIIN